MILNEICGELGINEGSSPEELFALLHQGNLDPFDGLFSDEDSRQNALTFFNQLNEYNIRVVRQVGPPQERYCKIAISGEARPVLVALIGECRDALPSDMENLIGWVLLFKKNDLGARWIDDSSGRFLSWRSAATGLAIIAEPAPTDVAVSRTIAAMLCLDDAGHGIAAAPPSLTHSASEVLVGRTFTDVQARLVFEAMSVSQPKWRFLSLYRILENAYLTNIKNALIEGFDRDADKAIEEAQKKLSSEVNQLISLMESKGLQDDFVAFNEAFDEKLALNNRFIHALDKSAKKEANYGNKQTAIKAVVRFYKLRCSIAHAGTSSVIYEQLTDANFAMNALLPYVESIVLKGLNVTLPAP